MTVPSRSLKELFLSALEVAPADRAAWLDRECGGDAGLRRQLHLMLAAHDAPHSLLDQPALAEPEATLDQPPLEKLGTQIGPYKLLQEIGQGGMGVVYMAEQLEPVRRKVALKIIKPGMDTRQVIARFEAERQALSLMDHPNIAKVLDAGTTDSGRPYFVMELVKGQPITEYCDEQHLTPCQRLEMLVPVCQAIQHAHQKGIIHRDVKPSNILVAEYDGRPVPKVIDFGVAKAISQPLTEKTMFTGYGQIVGTLEYMSPEQARVNQLDIDTRSDIYSLGVLLYELLTGTTPFDKQRLRSAAWDEMLRIIREEEPPKPSTRLSESKDSLPSVSSQRQTEPAKLTKLMRGELDWIVMKALEKDRSRRYETANGLALDIQRYLNDEPVAACPPSAAYRFRKYARRNKAALVTVGLVAAALVVGLVGTTWQAIRATMAERQARASAEAEAAQRAVAEAAVASERQAKEAEAAQRQLAEAAAQAETEQRHKAEASEKQAAEEAAVAKAVNDFLQQDLLGVAGAAAQLEANLEPDPNLKLATLLDRALTHVDERFAAQPRVRAEVQATLARAFRSLGRYEEATRLFEQVRQYCEAALGPEHADTLLVMYHLAENFRVQGQYGRAESLYAQCLEIQRRVLGPEEPRTLMAMSNLAELYRAQARYAEAEPLLTKCLEIHRRVLGPEHPQTLMAMQYLAELYRGQARYAEAAPLFTQCLEIQRRVLGIEHPGTLTSMHNLAVLFQNQGKYAEAVPLCTQCLEITSRAFGPEHPRTLLAMNNLASLYRVQGNFAAAEPLFTQCLDVQRRVLRPEHPDMLTSMAALAELLLAQQQYAEAEPLYTQCLETQRRVLGPEHPDTLASLGSLAELYRRQARYAEAEPLSTQCLEIHRRVLGPEHPHTLLSMSNLAFLHQNQGKYAEAESLFTQCLEISRRALGPEHPRTLAAMNNLASMYWQQQKLDQSIPIFEETLRLQKKVMGADHPETLLAMANLGVNYRDAGRLAEALPLLEQACQASQKYPALSWVGEQLANAYVQTGKLADAYLQSGKLAEAAHLAKEQLERARAALPQDSPELAAVLAQTGRTLLQAQAWNDAEAVVRECLALREQQAPDDWRTFNTKSMLGGTLLGQKKYADAEPLLLAGYEGMKARVAEIPPEGMTRLIFALERLVQLYTEWEKADQAAAWQEKLDEQRKSSQQCESAASSDVADKQPASPENMTLEKK